ncbi:hypothetical protein DL768_003092 [Monosporascus sp. mg162]|nr:hypothetical protein DL768_003092 [Monosporascus sp. mg162]
MFDNGKGKVKGKEKGKNTVPPEPEATGGQTAALAAGPRRRSVVPAEPRPWMTVQDFSLPGGSRNKTTSPSGPPPDTWTASISYTQPVATGGQGATSGWDEDYPVAKLDFSSPRHKVQGAPSGPPAIDYLDSDFSVPDGKDKEDKDKRDNNKKGKGKKDKTDKNDKGQEAQGLFLGTLRKQAHKCVDLCFAKQN